MNTKNQMALKSRSVIAFSGAVLALVAPNAYAQTGSSSPNAQINPGTLNNPQSNTSQQLTQPTQIKKLAPQGNRSGSANRTNNNAPQTNPGGSMNQTNGDTNLNQSRTNAPAPSIDQVLLRAADMLQASRQRASSNIAPAARQPYSAAQASFTQMFTALGRRVGSGNSRSFVAVSSAQTADDIRILRYAARTATANRQTGQAERLNRAVALYAAGTRNFFTAELRDALNDTALNPGSTTAFTLRHVPNQDFPNASFQNGTTDSNFPQNGMQNGNGQVIYSNGAIVGEPGLTVLPTNNNTVIQPGGVVGVGAPGTNPNVLPPTYSTPTTNNPANPPISNGNPPANNPATPHP